jgi:hypothetical protein
MPPGHRAVGFTSCCLLALALGGCSASGGRDVVARPPAPKPPAPPRATALHVRVVDARTGVPIPAMVALFPDGASERLRFGNNGEPGTGGMGATSTEVGTGGALLTWHGIAVWRGEAVVPVGVEFPMTGPDLDDRSIPHGRYRLVANRGIEYDLGQATVDLSAGRGEVFVEIPLARVVGSPGYLAADLHVHTGPGSGDTRLTAVDRVKVTATAGVEVVVASDHDHHTDLGEAVRQLWPQPGDPAPLATVVGNEATAPGGHFNVFPVAYDPSQPGNGAPRPPPAPIPSRQFLEGLRALPGAPVIQMNHGRLGSAAYFDHAQCGPWRDRNALPTCSLDFDAMEVLSGYLSCGTKIAAQVADWYALLSFGVVTTATGNSDSHGTSRLLGGYPRTYVRVPVDRLEAFRLDDFVAALRARRAVATTGPFLTLRVNERAEQGDLLLDSDGRLAVDLRMQAPSWVVVDEVRLLVDGQVAKTWTVPRAGGATPLLEVSGEPLVVSTDAFVTAEAHGRKALPPDVVGEWTSIARAPNDGPFTCPPLPGAEPGMAVFAVTNAVLVDVDGDGRFRGKRQPASFPAPAR